VLLAFAAAQTILVYVTETIHAHQVKFATVITSATALVYLSVKAVQQKTVTQ